MGKATSVIGYQPNFLNIEKLVSEGLIYKKYHNEDPSLVIYNYTNKAQYRGSWSKDELICRGLIVKDGTIIARPFPKFFNHFEFGPSHKNILKGPWKQYEKMDGSLGILYEVNGDHRIATRGTFHGKQADWATKRFSEVRGEFNPLGGQTYLFEIIYPENRVVVDYGKTEDLVLLDVLDTETGLSVDRDHWPDHNFTVCDFHGIEDSIPTNERSNAEGYVLVNDKGLRIKVKHREYLHYHSILSHLSSRVIWENLRGGFDTDRLFEDTPDEFYDWINKVISSLRDDYNGIEIESMEYLLNKPKTEDRKELSKYFSGYKYPFILFNMLDNKDYSDKIWELIKPKLYYPTLINQDQETIE